MITLNENFTKFYDNQHFFDNFEFEVVIDTNENLYIKIN